MKFSNLILTISFFVLLSQFNLIDNTAVDYDEGKILVTKNILNNYVVESQDVTVKYTVYNVGTQYMLFLEDFSNNNFLFVFF